MITRSKSDPWNRFARQRLVVKYAVPIMKESLPPVRLRVTFGWIGAVGINHKAESVFPGSSSVTGSAYRQYRLRHCIPCQVHSVGDVRMRAWIAANSASVFLMIVDFKRTPCWRHRRHTRSIVALTSSTQRSSSSSCASSASTAVSNI